VRDCNFSSHRFRLASLATLSSEVVVGKKLRERFNHAIKPGSTLFLFDAFSSKDGLGVAKVSVITGGVNDASDILRLKIRIFMAQIDNIHETKQLRLDAREIFQAAVDSVLPDKLIQDHISVFHTYANNDDAI
jgi:hypothetical protein